jgi:hypothetical protein
MTEGRANRREEGKQRVREEVNVSEIHYTHKHTHM